MCDDRGLRPIGSIRRVDYSGQERRARRERLEALARAGTAGRITVGCDLGQASDPTAIAVSHTPPGADPLLAVRSLERLPLGTSYLVVVDWLKVIVDDLQTMNRDREKAGEGTYAVRLLVDATGLGRPVLDLCEARGLRPIAVTLTGADTIVWHDRKTVSVGKGPLITGLGLLMEQRRLRLPDTSEAEVLTEEMRDFQRKVRETTGHVTFQARSGRHDDLILATALSVAVDLPEPEPWILAQAKAKRRW